MSCAAGMSFPNVSQTSTIFFFFNDTATTEIYTLSLHDALPISYAVRRAGGAGDGQNHRQPVQRPLRFGVGRSEEHTSELQSQSNLVCRLLLEKNNSLHELSLHHLQQDTGLLVRHLSPREVRHYA